MIRKTFLILLTTVTSAALTLIATQPRTAFNGSSATAAATGAITGAVIVLSGRAIIDFPTAIIGLISLAVLWRYKVPEPVIVAISGVVGLILWPLIRSL